VGFITLLIIDIGVIRELAIGASIGVAVIVFTNLILLPVAISYVGISKRAIERSKKDAHREHPFWRLLSNFASAKVAPVSVLLALVAFGGGLWYSQNLKIGDLDQGRRSCVRTRATTRTTTSSSATTPPAPTCWW
jgi:predicted RND superfamily exporter protein